MNNVVDSPTFGKDVGEHAKEKTSTLQNTLRLRDSINDFHLRVLNAYTLDQSNESTF